MNLFKRKQKAVAPARLAVKLADRIDRVQINLSAWLNKKTANFSVRGKWVFLVAVCLLFGGCSLYLLIQAFI